MRSAASVFVHEGRVLLADRTLWIVALLFVGLVGYGLYNGAVETDARAAAIEAIRSADDAAEAARHVEFENIMAGTKLPDPFANPTDPSSMGGGYGARNAIMPNLRMAPLAFGQADLLPSYYRVSNGSRIGFIYDTEIENPWSLLSGHFDLAFVVTYLVPLLIFALSYNFLSGDREQGTLRMLLAQPVGLAGVVAGKLGVRLAVVLACAVLLPCVALLVARPELRSAAELAALGTWAALVSAYVLFWFALVLAVNAFGRSSAANALTLIGCWVVLVLVAPVVMNLAVSLASPTPSRTELATRTRVVTAEALERYSDLFGTDYEYTADPALLVPRDGKIEVAPRLRAFYLEDRDVDRDLDVLLEQFETRLAGQQALVGRYGFLSPAVSVYEGITALAGTGLRRHQHFQKLIKDFHREWKAFFEPKILGGLAISESDLARFPRFEWQEIDAHEARSEVASRLLQVAVPALLLIALGAWRLRRYSVV
ncbi:MAG TPA: ABC transporter permease subunit [Gammaproteobacteria bacterium]|nr:ABC transporter permease subunit [Gammaproteobacteria bacterium]